MDANNRNYSWTLLLIVLCIFSSFFSWHFYKNNIYKLGCTVADMYCSITGEGYLCDVYREKNDNSFCLPPAGLNEWLEYKHANQDVLNKMLKKPDVIEMMRHGNFEKLENYFLGVQSSYESREINELAYEEMMDSLKHDADEVVAMYDDWLENIPDSYIARFGKGATNNRIGWNKRGTKWAKETSRDNLTGMRKYHLLAFDDLRAAVALYPKLTIGYRDLISIDKNRSGTMGKDYWLAESIKHDPYNYIARKAYMLNLRPRWGGSHHKMHEFSLLALQHADKNPVLRGLPAYEYADKASVFVRRKLYLDAIEAGSTAIYHRPAETAFHARAYANQQAKRYKEAVVDAEQGLKQEPDNIELLHVYAWSSRSDRQYEKSDDGFERLIRLRPDNAMYWYARGMLHNSMKKHVTKMEYWKKSHELEPSNTKYIFWYAVAAITNNNPVGLVKIRSYLNMCINSKCRQQDVNWAKRWIVCVDGLPGCDMDEHDYLVWQKSPLYSPQRCK